MSGAATPAELPASDWKAALRRTWKEAGDDNIGLIAAGVAFYAFLAFVPLLGALVMSYGLVAEPASVVRHVQALTRLMPADAARLVGEQLLAIVQSSGGRTGFGLIVALLLSLYGAMKGAGAIVTALNIAYEVKEARGFVRRTLVTAGMTLGAVGALLLAMLAVSAMGLVERLLPFSGPAAHLLVQLLLWAAAAAGVSLFVAAVYRYAPNRPTAPWRWISPGSIAATITWLLGTLAFGLYVSRFGNYNATYGSLGAVVVLLTWLYLSGYVLLMGAELNSELEKKAEPQ